MQPGYEGCYHSVLHLTSLCLTSLCNPLLKHCGFLYLNFSVHACCAGLVMEAPLPTFPLPLATGAPSSLATKRVASPATKKCSGAQVGPATCIGTPARTVHRNHSTLAGLHRPCQVESMPA
jgi:hypothetical protein